MNQALLLAALGSFLLAMIVTFLAEKKWIPFLMRIKMGQTILEIGPRWHKSKEGTPTMGGIFFAGGILVSLLAFVLPAAIRENDYSFVKIAGLMALSGCIGFIDDFVKFVKKRNRGLSPLQKLILQFAVAAGFLYSMKGSLSTAISLPFTSYRLELGVFYWVFSILFIVYITNAANLTDGIDGLAASCSFVIAAYFLVVSYFAASSSKTLFFAALCGGMIGFLMYNFYPARIFMGDTGSLFLGGALAGAAYWFDTPLIILISGLFIIWEGVSVVLQVLFYKLTKKRIFKMAPFHHHLELCGWKETKIVAVAALCTALFCVVAYFAF